MHTGDITHRGAVRNCPLQLFCTGSMQCWECLARHEVAMALEDLLMDIREEFRHILYHLHDPEFFRVVEPTHDWLTLAETAKK